jgi:hypothetical protein
MDSCGTGYNVYRAVNDTLSTFRWSIVGTNFGSSRGTVISELAQTPTRLKARGFFPSKCAHQSAHHPGDAVRFAETFSDF